MLNLAEDAPRILVTGASGNIGSATLAGLVDEGIGAAAGVSAESRLASGPPGIESRLCDFRDFAGVANALHGIDSALLLIPFCEEMVAYGRAFAAAARQAGVRFILRVSGLSAALDCPSRMGQLHGQIDAAVAEAGIGHGILRCNAFMQNFSGHYRYMIRNDSVLRLPEGTASMCFIDTRDIGEVAARILADPGPHVGKTYDLDGPEALSNVDAADVISSIVGRAVAYDPVSDDEARASYRRLGVSAWKIDVLESLSRFLREGHAARRTDDLELLLHRPPRTFRQFAADYGACWTAE